MASEFLNSSRSVNFSPDILFLPCKMWHTDDVALFYIADVSIPLSPSSLAPQFCFYLIVHAS